MSDYEIIKVEGGYSVLDKNTIEFASEADGIRLVLDKNNAEIFKNYLQLQADLEKITVNKQDFIDSLLKNGWQKVFKGIVLAHTKSISGSWLNSATGQVVVVSNEDEWETMTFGISPFATMPANDKG